MSYIKNLYHVTLNKKVYKVLAGSVSDVISVLKWSMDVSDNNDEAVQKWYESCEKDITEIKCVETDIII